MQYEKQVRWVLATTLLAACGAQLPLPPPPPPHRVFEASPLEALEGEIRSRIAQVDSAEISVSLIDLATARELHINSDVTMHAASTMKVPVLLEVFNRAQRNPQFLDSAVIVTNRFRSIADNSFFTLDPADDSEVDLYKKIGQPVNVRELARLMIVRSSNLATNVLIDLVTPRAVSHAVAEAGGQGMNVLRGVEDGAAFRKDMNNTTTARGFANVLAAIARCRSHARESCDQMIDILSAQEFNEMIPAGLPSGTRVAHKTGWITRVQHDGGIVFPPNRAPYVLVILTRGIADTAVAARAGADISRLVWRKLTDPSWEGSPSGLTKSARAINDLYVQHRIPALTTRVFTHTTYWEAVEPFVSAPLQREQIGLSAEGRPLYLVRYGDGPQKVLLWSQMHGDESTATLALADMMRYLHDAQDARTAEWARKLTILMIPMLNPDGAETFTRQNALGIDVNRDARVLSTPEARALKSVRDRYVPQFGFNLHDQNSKTRIGNTQTVAAIALLAPPTDSSRRDNPTSLRAKQVAAVIRNAIEPFVPGHIAKYDDTFNPRAFGDLMQSWGTSTVLIESGGWKDDPQKQYLRRVNFVALTAAFDAIASGDYEKADIAAYESLLMNGPPVNDLVIRGGMIVVPGYEPYRADLSIDVTEMRGEAGSARIVEIGDLAHVQARDTVDATGLFVHPERRTLRPTEMRLPRHRLTVGAVPALTITRGLGEGSEPVYSVQHGDRAIGNLVRTITEAEITPVGPIHPAVGCYTAELSTWSEGMTLPDPYRIPAKFQLLWRYGTSGMELQRLIVRPIGNAYTGMFRFMMWQPVEGGGIHVTFATGFATIAIQLAPQANGFAGTGTYTSDVRVRGRADPTARVTLQKINCP